MPIYKTGDMWSAFEEVDLFLITTNSTLTRNGALVMGAGIAKQAKQRFPGIEKAFGTAVQSNCGNFGEYNLLVSPRWPTAKLGAFQTKMDWKNLQI